MNNTQHGLRRGRSCLSAKDLGIDGKLGIWFFQFLTNRTHYVRLPGGKS